MKIRIRYFLTVLPLLLCVAACRNDPYKVNISSIKADIEIKRLEIDLFSISPDEIIGKLPELKEKYGSLLQLFSLAINTGDIGDPSFGDFLVRFCTDKQNNDVFNLTMQKYPDLEAVEKGLESGFRHYKHYFPGKVVP